VTGLIIANEPAPPPPIGEFILKMIFRKGESMLRDITEKTVASKVRKRYSASFFLGNLIYLKIRKIFLIMKVFCAASKLCCYSGAK
jgi:hypothetical protein